jgi:hypothetical protein
MTSIIAATMPDDDKKRRPLIRVQSKTATFKLEDRRFAFADITERDQAFELIQVCRFCIVVDDVDIIHFLFRV